LRISLHSIKTKLLLLLIIPLLLFIFSSQYLLSSLSSTVDRLSDRLYETGSEIMRLMLNADRDFYQSRVGFMSATVKSSNGSSLKAVIASYEENLGQTKDNVAAAKALIEERGLQDLEHEATGKTLSDLMQLIESGLASWEVSTAEVIQQPETLTAKQAEIDAVFEVTRSYLELIELVMEQYQLQAIAEEKDAASMLKTAMYISLAVEWIVLLGAGLWIIWRISRTIDSVRSKTQRVSEGYLDMPDTTRYTKDELGHIQKDIDDMIVHMRRMIGEIANSSRSVSAAASELAASAVESTNASTHVAENIQEVTGLVEVQANITSETNRAISEMAVGVQRIAESAGTIAAFATDTDEQAQQGAKLIMKLQEQMDIMTGDIARLERIISELSDKSTEIGAITENITAFANQTGILSLNASIEAARAGEQGRGFAVIAGEIRKLAANSLESANTINHLVSNTQLEIANASESMQTTITQVERGAELMQEVARGFQAIAASIRQVSGQIHDMSAVTEQMSASSEEVTASMEQAAASIRDVSGKAGNVAAATEEQLALVENISSSAEQLRGIVDDLNKAVAYFKIK